MATIYKLSNLIEKKVDSGRGRIKKTIEQLMNLTRLKLQQAYPVFYSQQTTFTLENQCEPIPDYMKEQLFDAFSRRPGETLLTSLHHSPPIVSERLFAPHSSNSSTFGLKKAL